MLELLRYVRRRRRVKEDVWASFPVRSRKVRRLVYTREFTNDFLFITPAQFCKKCVWTAIRVLTYRDYHSIIPTGVHMTLSTAKSVRASLYLLRAGHIITLARAITATYNGYCTTRRTPPKTSTIQFCEDC